MRKLATIRRIADVQPIENADAIEVVTVGGWKVVSKKGEFQPGDLCVYFEIDSVLPIREEFEFLRKGCYVKKEWLESETNPTGEGFRLKTIKLRGQVSQGLVVPVIPDGDGCRVRVINKDRQSYDRVLPGEDVTELLGVVKWDPPLPATLSGKVKGYFPSFIRKTDQERIQNLADQLDKLYAQGPYEVTIKLDGSSMTAFHNDGELGVCSRNLHLDIEADRETTFARVFYENKLDVILPQLGNIAIQGELMGPGIQGNREKLQKHEIFVFDIYNINEGRYLASHERVDLITKITEMQNELGVNNVIQHAPIWSAAQGIDGYSIDDFLSLAEGDSLTHPVREGLVFKSTTKPSLSFKVISNKFLLKGGE